MVTRGALETSWSLGGSLCWAAEPREFCHDSRPPSAGTGVSHLRTPLTPGRELRSLRKGQCACRVRLSGLELTGWRDFTDKSWPPALCRKPVLYGDGGCPVMWGSDQAG